MKTNKISKLVFIFLLGILVGSFFLPNVDKKIIILNNNPTFYQDCKLKLGKYDHIYNDTNGTYMERCILEWKSKKL